MVIQQCNADFFWIARIVSKLPYFLVLGYNKCLLLQCQWDMDAPTDNVPFSYEVEYDSVIHAYKSESYAGYQWPSGLSYFSVENAAELYISLLLGWGLSESIFKEPSTAGWQFDYIHATKKKAKENAIIVDNKLLWISVVSVNSRLALKSWWDSNQSHLITPPVTPQMLKYFVRCRVSTPPETNSSHLIIDGWKTVLSLLGLGLFSRGEVKIFGEATASKNHFGTLGQCYRKKKSTLEVWRRLGPDFCLKLGTWKDI